MRDLVACDPTRTICVSVPRQYIFLSFSLLDLYTHAYPLLYFVCTNFNHAKHIPSLKPFSLSHLCSSSFLLFHLHSFLYSSTSFVVLVLLSHLLSLIMLDCVFDIYIVFTFVKTHGKIIIIQPYLHRSQDLVKTLACSHFSVPLTS